MRNLFYSFVLRFFNLKKSSVPSEKNGLILVLIDGLGYRELENAIRRNYCPFFSKLLKQGYQLHSYYSEPPASTTASEAELFFGRHDNIPGFTWYDRTLQRFVRGNRGADIDAFEKAYMKPVQLLENGSCILGVFNGGATQLGVSSKDMDRNNPITFIRKLHILVFIFLNPIRFIYTWYLILKSIILSLYSLLRLRSKRKVRFIMNEAFNRIFLGNISTYVAELEILRETPILFIDYLLYDEFAHEYGLGKRTTLSSLKLISWYCQSLYKTSRKTARKYDFIILADHGQTKSVPFDGLASGRLEKLIEKEAAGCKVVKTMGVAHPQEKTIYLVPAGSTVQLYLSDHIATPTYRSDITAKFPHLERALLNEKQIGWLLIRINKEEQCLIGKQGEVLFRNGKVASHSGNITVDGRILASFANYARFNNNGDIVIFGNTLHDDKVIAFEEHRGTHGGFAGDMTMPFIMTDIKPLLRHIKENDHMDKVFAAIRSLKSV